MPSGPTEIEVQSLAELEAAQPQIVERFASDQLAAQLFMVDPVRALAGVGVKLSAAAVREWARLVPELSEHEKGARFEQMRALGVNTTVTVKISGILPPPGVDVAAEDELMARQLSGFDQDPAVVPPSPPGGPPGDAAVPGASR